MKDVDCVKSDGLKIFAVVRRIIKAPGCRTFKLPSCSEQLNKVTKQSTGRLKRATVRTAECVAVSGQLVEFIQATEIKHTGYIY
jgi:hypothetical protein